VAHSAHAKSSAHPGYNQTPTRYIEAKGTRFAYRVVGEDHGGTPLVLLQHFTGTMDDWDRARK
jgi:pimeloyl-ACP methyl ester carboxylesterase